MAVRALAGRRVSRWTGNPERAGQGGDRIRRRLPARCGSLALSLGSCRLWSVVTRRGPSARTACNLPSTDRAGSAPRRPLLWEQDLCEAPTCGCLEGWRLPTGARRLSRARALSELTASALALQPHSCRILTTPERVRPAGKCSNPRIGGIFRDDGPNPLGPRPLQGLRRALASRFRAVGIDGTGEPTPRQRVWRAGRRGKGPGRARWRTGGGPSCVPARGGDLALARSCGDRRERSGCGRGAVGMAFGHLAGGSGRAGGLIAWRPATAGAVPARPAAGRAHIGRASAAPRSSRGGRAAMPADQTAATVTVFRPEDFEA